MGIDGVGSSVVIALAAALWLLYLVPTWLRRREYLSTERNALRLQQTLRVLAESAEIPETVRTETSARAAAQQERVLRAQLKRQDAVARAQDAAVARAAARRLAETTPAIAADVAVTSTAGRRLRRSRAITTLLLLASFVAAGFGALDFMATGAWLLLVTGAIVATGCFAMLGQMASVAKARRALSRELRTRPAVQVREAPVVEQAAPQRAWTPVPIPKPLYAAQPRMQRAVATSLEAAAELRQAAADAERALREAARAPEVTPIRRAAPLPAAFAQPTPRPAAPSRFASMGIVEQPESGLTDLDAVLRRRRHAG